MTKPLTDAEIKWLREARSVSHVLGIILAFGVFAGCVANLVVLP